MLIICGQLWITHIKNVDSLSFKRFFNKYIIIFILIVDRSLHDEFKAHYISLKRAASEYASARSRFVERLYWTLRG